MNILRVVARPLLASPFIVDGFDALRRPSAHVARSRDVLEVCEPVMERLDIEFTDEHLLTLTRVMGGTSLVAGVALASGKAPRASAAVLAALSVPVAVVNASESIRGGQSGDFARRLAMIGALAIASADRVGSPSAHWRYRMWRSERRERLQAHAQVVQAQIAQGHA